MENLARKYVCVSLSVKHMNFLAGVGVVGLKLLGNLFETSFATFTCIYG